MSNSEILKMLFVEHHRQLSETRKKIQSLTERVVGLLTLATGWLLTMDRTLDPKSYLFVILAVSSVGLGSIVALVRYNRSYRRTARVIAKINASLGLFDHGKFLSDERIYPEEWMRFGNEPWWRGILIHGLLIIVMSVVCVLAASVLRGPS